MSRLYDRIVASKQQFWASQYMDWQPYTSVVDAVIVADNVAEYRAWHEKDDPDQWITFPNVAPPFDHFFIETKRPSKYPDWYPLAWGIEIQVEDAQSLTSAPVTRPDTGERLTYKATQSKWAYKLFLFTEFKKHRPNLSLSGYGAIRPDGSVAPMWNWFAPPHDDPDEETAVMKAKLIYDGWIDNKGLDYERYVMAYQHLLMCVPFMAISFMNCKNVDLIDNPPPPALSKSHQKKTGQPLVNYKTIKVTPMRTVKHVTDLDTQNAPHTPQSADMPLSIWRGHFKDYRDGKGLFGNPAMKGVYWWDQHVRGSIDNGVTVKDYEVKAPNQCHA